MSAPDKARLQPCGIALVAAKKHQLAPGAWHVIGRLGQGGASDEEGEQEGEQEHDDDREG